MESDLPSSSKIPTKKIINKSGDTNMEICHLVSESIGLVILAVGPSASKDDHIESKKEERRCSRKLSIGA
ncbi:hypothetical protein AYI70_g8428 [Smittium culicis]|uniref:Uncharacterized protein n=1 Tax=Smittium culicis TaxID=133412 RepID=A0A1R1XFY5_9FUNG|nr:hypothetical protein AYI70_g8428 [Smittium culicis]